MVHLGFMTSINFSTVTANSRQPVICGVMIYENIMKFINARLTSIFLSSNALLCPFVLYFSGLFDPPKTDRYVCGLYILGPIFFTVILVFLLSISGIIFGIYSFKKACAPRTILRKSELFFLFIPLFLVLAYVGTFILLGYGIIK